MANLPFKFESDFDFKRTIKFLRNSLMFKVFVLVFVLLFSFILRAHNFDKEPAQDNLEEMLYSYSGIYLLETGVPVSWSTLDYPARAEIFRGKIDYFGSQPNAFVRLYRPWLDEPPLFSLLVGSFAHFYHASRTMYIPSAFIRTPIVLISFLTSILVFLVARYLSGFWMGILSLTIYSITPTFLIGSRMAVPENLIALLFLVMIYLLIKFQEKLDFRWLLVIPLLGGIGGLSKPTGFLIVPLAIFMAVKNKFYKTAVYLFLVTVPFVVAFILYGIHYDAQIFWHLFSIQGFRPVGFKSLAFFLTSPAYYINELVDGWYVFCLMASIYFVFVTKDMFKQMVTLGFVYWILVVMLTGGQADLLPWYRYPAFPLMAILGAWGLRFLYEKANFFASFLISGLLLTGRSLTSNAFHSDILPTDYRLVMSGLLAPSALGSIWNKRWLGLISKAVIIGVVLFGIYFNIIFIYNQFEIECESKSCPITVQTKLSELHFPIIWKLFVYH